MTAADEARPGGRWFVNAAALVVLAYGLWWAERIVLLLLLATFLAVLVAPVVTWLGRLKMPRVAAVLLVVAALGLVLLGFAAMVGGSVNEFVRAVPRYQERIDRLGEDTLSRLEGWGLDAETLRDLEFVSPGAVIDFIGASLKGIGAVVSQLLLVLLVLVFMLLEAGGLPVKLAAAWGGGGRPDQLAVVTRNIRRYLGVKTAVSLGTGLCAGLLTWMVGLDFALVWGLVAFLLNYIPTIGSIIAAAPPALLALLSHGPGTAIGIAVGYFAINTVFGNVIEPHLQGRALGLSTLAVILSLLVWGWLWGTVGALLAVPLTMVIKLACEQSPSTRWLSILLGPARELETSGAVARAAPPSGDRRR